MNKRITMRLFSLRASSRKRIALCLIFIFLTNIFFPTASWALTGGPSQPEVESFEPIGTSQMVDPFSGDFNYNIPLLDIDGYPINLSYHSGITMDQEASWVGLGWNINPGVINRGMRGVPDDFNGDLITREFNVKPNRTFGINASASLELFGKELKNIKLTAGASMGIKYNNYRGFGLDVGVNAGMSIGLKSGQESKSPNTLHLGLSLNNSSDEGLTIAPSAGFSRMMRTADHKQSGLGLNIGLAFNARSGLKKLSVDVNAYKKDEQTKKNDQGEDVYSGEFGVAGEAGSQVSSSFDYGTHSYSPEISMPMENLSISGRFKLGFELIGTHPNFSLAGYYSTQRLREKNVQRPAYGYMNYDAGENNATAMLDFNREKDGAFTENTPVLPISYLTYDVYSVSGQGIGGSYRSFRGDIGHIFDPYESTSSQGYNIGVELGLGNTNHWGGDLAVNDAYSYQSKWSDENNAENALFYRASTGNPLYEKSYLKEANEKSVNVDPVLYQALGAEKAVRFKLDEQAKFKTVAQDKFVVDRTTAEIQVPSVNYHTQREKRNQLISVLTQQEVSNGLGLDNVANHAFTVPTHHIGEVTTTGSDGRRYVYGIAAYNTDQQEVTFAVGDDISNNPGHTGNCNTGLVNYHAGTDNSTGNTHGIDNYYNNTIMPPFAHSYLLTAVLSPDYVDADNVKGPSNGDLGTWVKFSYSRIDDYQWRTPVQQNEAYHSEGLKADPTDDKASYVFGKKELWYVDRIESKNYIAIFEVDDRKDGCGVLGRDGGRDNNKVMKLLKKISLFSKPDFVANGNNAIPLKVVHFQYDYSLCKLIPNNNTSAPLIPDVETANQGGKLTLKKVFFTYQNSFKAKFSPYDFEYNGFNPNYEPKGYDRWGNYKPSPCTSCSCNGNSSTLPNSEFPYVDQDQTTADQYTSAWSMTDILLPSGGKINVQYESDDYAYVQNKRAMQMFKIVAVEGDPSVPSVGSSRSISDGSNKNRYLIFELQPGFDNSLADVQKYFAGIDNLYFRCLVEVISGRYEYVSGYAKVSSINITSFGGTNYGIVTLQPVKLKDGGNTDFNPISKAALQFSRINLSRTIRNVPGISDNTNFGQQVINALANQITNFLELIDGPNKVLWDEGKCRNIVTGKSWIRLNNPGFKKLGGGNRVKKLLISDEWNTLTSTQMNSFNYGQEYEYTLADGTSSGVASYEPQIGADENPWKEPVFYDEKVLLAPDEEFYSERPFGESVFPSAGVGYSRVIVKNLQRTGVKRHATGMVIHEFYTAKDFPTITEETDVDFDQDRTNPLSILSLLNLKVRDYMTATQGFVVQLNDMHGKPKKQEVYQEDKTVPISSVEYRYKSVPYLNGSFRLQNAVTTIRPDGTTKTEDVGLFFDMSADMREQGSRTESVAAELNLDGFFIGPFYIPIPMIWPSIAKEETQFRSATTTKIIQRFGILEETIAKDLGSTVATKNLAYDAETGEVLLTQTTTDFNDQIFTLNYPVHWYYDQMGLGYKNIGVAFTNRNFNSTGTASLSNATAYFVEGDEVSVSGTKGWVVSVSTNAITIVDKAGLPITGSGKTVKVLRSGRKNMQMTTMASMTSLANPLTNFQSNLYENVIQASAVEFNDKWRTFCECFGNVQANTAASTNPFVLGIKGNWRPVKNYTHLTSRILSDYNRNTNIRKDGIFASYTPFYKLGSGKWLIDGKNWTFATEITEFNPFGGQIEEKDALGRFAAQTFGYNQTLVTARASNSRYQEIGFDNFEDYGFSGCADNHFKFPSGINIVNNESHTGKHSIKVASGSPVNLTRDQVLCEKDSCDILLTVTPIQLTAGSTITISGGAAPYQINYTVISGSPQVNFNNNFTQMTVSGAVWTIEVSVTDSKGCTTIKTVTKP